MECHEPSPDAGKQNFRGYDHLDLDAFIHPSVCVRVLFSVLMLFHQAVLFTFRLLGNTFDEKLVGSLLLNKGNPRLKQNCEAHNQQKTRKNTALKAASLEVDLKDVNFLSPSQTSEKVFWAFFSAHLFTRLWPSLRL